MGLLHKCFAFLLLFTTPFQTLCAVQPSPSQEQKLQSSTHTSPYDQLLTFIDDLECDTLEFDKKYSDYELSLSYLTLLKFAKQGAGDDNDSAREIDQLIAQAKVEMAYSPFYYASCDDHATFRPYPLLMDANRLISLSPHFVRSWSEWRQRKKEQCKHLWKNHKTEIIVGVVVVVAVVGVVAVATAPSTAAAGVVSGAQGFNNQGKSSSAKKAPANQDSKKTGSSAPEKSFKEDLKQAQETLKQSPEMQKVIAKETKRFKSAINTHHVDLSGLSSKDKMPDSERIKTLVPLLKHGYANALEKERLFNPILNQELKKVGDKNPYHFDLTTGTYNNTAATIKDVSTGHDINYKKASRILLIQRARQKGFIGEAIARTNQLLKEFPSDQDALVERGRNKIQCGYTKSAFNDFSKAFNIQSKLSKGDPVASANDYIKGFQSGFKEGGYELIRDTTTGLYHAIKDPTGTVFNIGHGMYDLAALAADGQGKQVFEKLLPNTYKLMTNSENLSFAERGRLHSKSAVEIAALYMPGKGMQAGSKLAKAIHATKSASKTIRMAQEAKIASNSLKNLGKSGHSKTLVSATTKTVPSSSITNRTTQVAKGAGVANTTSNAYVIAKNGGKHAALIRRCGEQTSREIQKSIKSLEKQIVKHQDKITNPTNHYLDWHKSDPRRREALINRKWPAEIQCFKEERDILQSILDQRMKN